MGGVVCAVCMLVREAGCSCVKQGPAADGGGCNTICSQRTRDTHSRLAKGSSVSARTSGMAAQAFVSYSTAFVTVLPQASACVESSRVSR